MKIGATLKKIASKLSSSQQECGIVVYVGKNCPCSRDVLATLDELGATVTVCDLEQYPDIRREHGAATPIVLMDGRMRFSGKVNRLLLSRMLAHRAKILH